MLNIMMLSDEDIEEFTGLYEKEFGERLSKQEASDIAGNFVSLYEFLAEPLPNELNHPASPKSDSADPPSFL